MTRPVITGTAPKSKYSKLTDSVKRMVYNVVHDPAESEPDYLLENAKFLSESGCQPNILHFKSSNSKSCTHNQSLLRMQNAQSSFLARMIFLTTLFLSLLCLILPPPPPLYNFDIKSS